MHVIIIRCRANLSMPAFSLYFLFRGLAGSSSDCDVAGGNDDNDADSTVTLSDSTNKL